MDPIVEVLDTYVKTMNKAYDAQSDALAAIIKNHPEILQDVETTMTIVDIIGVQAEVAAASKALKAVAKDEGVL